MNANCPCTHDEALLALVLAGGPAAPRRRLLLAHADPLAAWHAGPATWNAHGCEATQRSALLRPDPAAIAAVLAWRAAGRRHLIGLHEPDYPALLRHAANPPLALFAEGDPGLLWHPGVAVVGSRNPSAGGREHAQRFAIALGRAGLAVVSGMASGIDAAAHLAALEHGLPTVAVLGTGPDLAYPPRHRQLRDRLAAQGLVVSEHPPGTIARAGHFPARNRLIAGLALGTVVVEAAHRSGALITARLAAEAGREVFALPGSIDNPLSRGCHRLLREGASLVETPEEVVAGLGALPALLAAELRQRLGVASPAPAPGPSAARDGPDYHRLWQALGPDPTPMDLLVQRTGLTAAALSSMLLHMELEGRVVVEHGRYTRRI